MRTEEIICGTKEELLDYFKFVEPFTEDVKDKTAIEISVKATVKMQLEALVEDKKYFGQIFYLSFFVDEETKHRRGKIVSKYIKIEELK